MSTGLSPEKLSGNKDAAQLKIVKQPPTHVFPDEPFEVGLTLHLPPSLTNKALFDKTKTNILICAEIYFYSRGKVISHSMNANDEIQLVMEPTTIVLPIKRTSSKETYTKARCKIKSSIHSTKITTYCIRFFSSQDDFSVGNLQPIFSRPVQIVNAKIKIAEDDQWEKVWYKDEGGRDKCMQAIATLHGRDGKIITKRKIPLKLTLVYDNDQFSRVMKQETLRILGPSEQFIDHDDGKAVLQFRIEEVSKNHQGQNFIVEIGPDTSKVFDIAPAYTPPVSVRSKRNKRQRTTSGRADSASSPHGLMSSRHGIVHPATDLTGSPMHGYSGVDLSQGLPGTPDVVRLRHAMKGIIHWTEEVVNGLFPLKWQIIGYAQFSDGSVDYTRPYHSMPNPNECISRILSMYSEETRENLRILLSAVENTSPQESAGADFRAVQGDHQPTPLPIDQAVAMGAAKMPQIYEQEKSQVTQVNPMQGTENLHFGQNQTQGPYSYTQIKQPMQYAVPSMRPHHSQQIQQPLGNQYGQSMNQMQGVAGSPMIPIHQTPTQPQAKGHRDLDQVQDEQAEEDIEGESRQADVQFVLAKQFKSLRTGERLGFPAYSGNKELLGFYIESNMKVGVGRFEPISRHRDEFGQREMLQAARILEEAIQKGSQAVHSLKDWGTLSSMVDHALVYDWSKDLGKGEHSNSSGDADIGDSSHGGNGSPQSFV